MSPLIRSLPGTFALAILITQTLAAGPLFVGLKTVGVNDTGASVAPRPLVSGDGSTLVGQTIVYRDPVHSGVQYERQQGYVYQWNAKIQTIGALPPGTPDTLPGNSYATAVSADGRVVVGGSQDHAFRWEQGAGISELPGLNPNRLNQSFAYSVSADGNLVGGSWGSQAVLWGPHGQPISLGVPGRESDGASSVVYAMSSDGSIVAGVSATSSASGGQTFYGSASQSDVTTNIGSYLGQTPQLSADGSILLGNHFGPSFDGFVIRTLAGETTAYTNDSLGVNVVDMNVMTADGSLLGGLYSLGVDARAALFDVASESFIDVKTMLVNDYGLSQLGGWRLFEVTSMSADGKVLAGRGEFYSPTSPELSGMQGWVVDLRDQLVNTGFEVPGLNGWTVTGPGVAAAIGDPLDPANAVAALTTGSPVSISQTTATPDGAFTVSFDYWFQTVTGVLRVFLGDELLAMILAPGTVPSGWSHYEIVVLNPSLYGLSGAVLRFDFDGMTDSQVLLDNISIDAAATSAVPEPMSVTLLMFGGAAMSFARFRKRSKERRQNDPGIFRSMG